MIVVIVTALAVGNLLMLFLCPDLLAGLMGKGDQEQTDVYESEKTGSGKAVLTVAEEDRNFDGHGKFDPLEGIQALDTDGSDISGKVAVSYVSGKDMQEKEIHYTVYDSENERLEASCRLHLDGYQGPAITIEHLDKVSWKELQHLKEVPELQEMIKGSDGFGNDASAGITYSYEIQPDGQTVEVTFSLTNQFQDYRNEKIVIRVDDIPEEELMKNDMPEE